MKNTKAKPSAIKDADQIIDEFTFSCNVTHAATLFVKLYLANHQFRQKETIHPEAAWHVDPNSEETMKAITAINNLLYEIEKTFRASAQKSV